MEIRGQLNIFNLESENIIESTYNVIKNKLEKYGIDKIYEEEIKGNCWIFNKIYDRLSKEKRYEEYMKDMIEEVMKVIELVTFDYNDKRNGIFKYDEGEYDKFGFKVNRDIKNKDEIYKSQGPFFCLEMLPKELFEGGRK